MEPIPSDPSRSSGAPRADGTSGSVRPSEQLLDALLRPALVRIGGVVLPADRQSRLAALLHAVATVLSEGLEDGPARRGVRLDLLTAAADPAGRDASFGFALASREREIACAVTLDRAASRAIVDVIEKQLAALRGIGEITPTEHGLLEFTVLAALDELVPPDGGRLALSRFLSRAELTDEAFFAGFDPLDVRVSIAGREGIATIWFPRDAAPPSFDLAVAIGARGATAEERVAGGDVEAMLALPRLSLAPEEIAAVRRGDAVVLGASDLARFAPAMQIVTSNAWRLADARLERDAPGHVVVRTGNLAISVFQPPDPEEGRVLVQPVLGSVRLDLDRIREWRAGETIEFEKNPEAPVDLLIRERWFANGELVRADGELAVRILDVDDAIVAEFGERARVPGSGEPGEGGADEEITADPGSENSP